METASIVQKSAAPAGKERRSVVVIDPHRVSRLVMEEELDRSRVRGVLAATADEGLALVTDNPPSLIIIDLLLNGRDGLEVINQLRVNPSTREIPVMVVTGHDNQTEIDRVMKAGVVDLVRKPFPRGKVAALVDRYCNVGEASASSKILLVEDSETIRAITKFLLQKHGHSVVEAADGALGWQQVQKLGDELDMIITDISMPNMNGEELVGQIRRDERFRFIPIVISTTISDKESIKRLLSGGADDYIVKPFSSEEFIARIQSHLRVKTLYTDLQHANRELATFNETLERRVMERTRELRDANLDAIYSLAVAAEAKDDATGNHVYRIQHFTGAIARMLGLTEAMADEIGYSSIMHDVGKISVPDGILKKPGKLDADEFETMKAHTLHGERILPGRPFFRMARQIARSHHEKWDGNGYPDKLAGKDIPLPARITAVADVFDALVSRRCYKDAWSVEEAVAEIKKCAGSHFDPDVVDAFLRLLDAGAVEAILAQWKQ